MRGGAVKGRQERRQERRQRDLHVTLRRAESGHGAQQKGELLRMAPRTVVLGAPFEPSARHITINQVDGLGCQLPRVNEVECLAAVARDQREAVANGQRPHLTAKRRRDARAPQRVHPLFADVGVEGRQYLLRRT